LKRVARNSGWQGEHRLLKNMYDCWARIREYIHEQQIDSGICSIVELEKWARQVVLDNYKNVADNCKITVISKVSADRDEQYAVWSDVVAIYLM